MGSDCSIIPDSIYRARAEIVKTLASGFTTAQTEDSFRRLRETARPRFSPARFGIVVFTIPNRAEYKTTPTPAGRYWPTGMPAVAGYRPGR
jgi:hypothetical protein